jgi:hypothetical protein
MLALLLPLHVLEREKSRPLRRLTLILNYLNRYRQCEYGARPHIWFHMYIPSECLCQILTDGETQAHPFFVKVSMLCELREVVEKPRKLLVIHSNSCISHWDHQMAVLYFSFDSNWPILSELKWIRHQVDNNLLNSILIRPDHFPNVSTEPVIRLTIIALLKNQGTAAITSSLRKVYRIV